MKNVIVTGAAGGIGKATVNYLADNGYFVYALDLKKIDEIPHVKSFACDLTNQRELENVLKYMTEQNIKIDAIIHLCGIYYMDSLIEIEESKLKQIFDVNFFSVYLVNKVFLSLLKRRGKIIITSSEVAPLDPLPFNSIYSLTKHTLENYAQALRQELNLLDYQVVVIRPGAINTGMIDASIKNVERITKETKLYKGNAPLFLKIVAKNESKTIEPIRIAKLIKKIEQKQNPKLLYKINLNFKLVLLSFLPKRMQLKVIKKMITPKVNK